MSCDTEPVNIRDTIKQICKEECSYKFNYNPNSSAIVTNQNTYLDIKVDGNNNIRFNDYKVTLNDVRLYQPSLHLFDGQQVPAELIISHSGYGHTILVCVPIIVGNGRGKSNSFFEQLIPNITPNTDKTTPNKQSINVSKWSLNDVIPSSTFYFYVGKYPYPPCNGKVNVIVFGKNNAARISSKDLKLLQALISPVNYSQTQTLSAVAKTTPMLMVNAASVGGGGGGAMGPNAQGEDYFIFDECQPVDGMDSPKKKKKKAPDVSAFATIVLLLLGGLIVLALIWSVFGQKGGGGVRGKPTAGPASGAPYVITETAV